MIVRRNNNRNNEPESPGNDLGYADQLLRNTAQRKILREGNSEYRPLEHVSPTSNICERLFCRAKLLISATRKKMNPDSLNMLLFLKANRKLWLNSTIIQKILNERKKEGLNDEDNDDEAEDEIDDDSDEEY